MPAAAAACRKADFLSRANHINGVFAADIMRYLKIFAVARLRAFRFASKTRQRVVSRMFLLK
ncbi:hypothetical protein [Bradyrhizobium sp.]|jgi:hypothetical protein|uniref:hypothetical protein n=1 Tax=Bradyrhizobium sp. TaxID=376 RepID=UPI002E0A885D|nr:hypothetical protein [Bradyrhizobium sp.]